jgi:hypothetical protein
MGPRGEKPSWRQSRAGSVLFADGFAVWPPPRPMRLAFFSFFLGLGGLGSRRARGNRAEGIAAPVGCGGAPHARRAPRWRLLRPGVSTTIGLRAVRTVAATPRFAILPALVAITLRNGDSGPRSEAGGEADGTRGGRP